MSKILKGDENGECNREACNKIATHQHRANRYFYCISCAHDIQMFANVVDPGTILFEEFYQYPM